MKILVVRYSALGDILLTTGVIQWIKKKRPDTSIDLLTSTHLEEIFREDESINNIITLKKGATFSEIKALYSGLGSYDYIFDLQGNLKSALIAIFVKGKYFKISKQSYYRRFFVKFKLFREKLNKHIVNKYAEVCLPPLNIAHPKDEDLRPKLNKTSISKLLPKDIGDYIVIHPFASQKNKEWPYFKELIEKLISLGKTVVVVGQGSRSWPARAIDLSNQSSLQELMSIISGAQSLISTDSGPMHLGVALGIKTFAIFGPTTKEFGFFPIFKDCHIFENNKINCRPCHVHGGQSCPRGHFQCMKEISVGRVIQSFQKNN